MAIAGNHLRDGSDALLFDFDGSSIHSKCDSLYGFTVVACNEAADVIAQSKQLSKLPKIEQVPVELQHQIALSMKLKQPIDIEQLNAEAKQDWDRYYLAIAGWVFLAVFGTELNPKPDDNN